MVASLTAAGGVAWGLCFSQKPRLPILYIGLLPHGWPSTFTQQCVGSLLMARFYSQLARKSTT
jgi:hypothetical protein